MRTAKRGRPQLDLKRGAIDVFALALLFGLITATANVLGSMLAASRQREGGPAIQNYIGFGGGFLLAAAFFELIPESLEGGPTMPVYVIGGYMVVYLFEQLFATHAHEEPHRGLLPPVPAEGPLSEHLLAQEFHHPAAVISTHAGLAALVGFNVHDFIDGLAIGAAMVTSQTLGILVFLAVLLHEIPAGFSIAAIMLGSGRSRRAAVLAGSSIGLATLVGIVVPFALGDISDNVAHAFLALSAGSFVYIAATDLIPAAGAGGAGASRFPFLSVLVGMAVFLATAELAEQLLG